MAKNVKIEWNDKALQQLQDQANRAVQQVVREVNAEMAGQPAEGVFRELMRRIAGANFEPNEANLRTVAQSISDRTLTDNG